MPRDVSVERAARGAGDGGLAGKRDVLVVGVPDGRIAAGPAGGEHDRRLVEDPVHGRSLTARPASRPRAGARARARVPSTSTNSGPSNGSRAREAQSRTRAGSRARRGSAASPESESETRLKIAGAALARAPRARSVSSAAEVELAVGDRVAVRIVARVAERCRRSAPRAPRRCSARAPRPRRGPGPRASPAPRRDRPRSAGGGGSPRARPARPAWVSVDPVVRLVLDQAELGHPLQHRGHRPRRDAEPLGERRGRRPGPRARRASA